MSYGSGRAAFAHFCAALGHDPLPPSDVAATDTLLRFIEWLHSDRGLRPSSMAAYVSAVRFDWHRSLRRDPSAGSPLPGSFLAALAASSTLEPLFRRPFPSDWLPLSFDLSADPVVPLAFTIGFVFFLRVSEYLSVRSKEGALVTQLLAAHLWAHDGALHLFIAKSKTDLARRGSQHQRVACGGALCPVRLFEAYAASRPQPVAPDSPALVWSDGSHFTADDFNTLIKQVAARAGGDPSLFSSHSMRSGGVTAFHAAGANIATCIREGRWASIEGLMKYLRLDPSVGASRTAAMLGPLAACAAALAGGVSRAPGRFLREFDGSLPV